MINLSLYLFEMRYLVHLQYLVSLKRISVITTTFYIFNIITVWSTYLFIKKLPVWFNTQEDKTKQLTTMEDIYKDGAVYLIRSWKEELLAIDALFNLFMVF